MSPHRSAIEHVEAILLNTLPLKVDNSNVNVIVKIQSLSILDKFSQQLYNPHSDLISSNCIYVSSSVISYITNCALSGASLERKSQGRTSSGPELRLIACPEHVSTNICMPFC